jgi:hypothetical protein
MALNNKQTADILPPIALAALGADTDPEMKDYIKSLIQDRLAERSKEQRMAERCAKNAVQQAQEEIAARAARVRNCNHLKQDNRSTRLAGQKLSGTGQVALVCQFCHDVFHIPADKSLGQKEPAIHLIPQTDEIGGF